MTAVYYCWAGDDLLYVGMTREPHTRFKKHRSRLWWDRVDEIDLEWHPTVAAASAAEKAAIARYRPEFNYMNARRPRPRIAPAPPL